jgi:hypothetical protein
MITKYYIIDSTSSKKGGRKYLLRKNIYGGGFKINYECFSLAYNYWGEAHMTEYRLKKYGILITKEEAEKRALIQKMSR